MKINWLKLPFGFLIEKNKLRRTSWEIRLAISSRRKEKYHAKGSRRVLYGLRFMEWPWNGYELQLYWNGKLVKCYRREYY